MKAGLAVLISEKIDFKAKNITKEKARHFIMIKESINQKDIIITNVHVPCCFQMSWC